MSANPKAWLSQPLTFNNPKYLVWKRRPAGLIDFEQYKQVELVKPTKAEQKRLMTLATMKNMEAFVINLEGCRVFLTRDMLLTEEEYNEVRHQQDQVANDKARQERAKLALLKDAERNLG